MARRLAALQWIPESQLRVTAAACRCYRKFFPLIELLLTASIGTIRFSV